MIVGIMILTRNCQHYKKCKIYQNCLQGDSFGGRTSQVPRPTLRQSENQTKKSPTNASRIFPNKKVESIIVPSSQFQVCQWSSWSFGPCSVSCGQGLQPATRQKQNYLLPVSTFLRWLQRGGGSCVGPTVATRQCNEQPCPPPGGSSYLSSEMK